MSYEFLTENSPKTVKGEAAGYLTGILYLAPANLSGVNVCPFSTPACRESCLNTAGRGGIGRVDEFGRVDNKIQKARIRRTRAFLADRQAFLEALARDIARLILRAKARGLKPAVRLNGTSDLRFERMPWYAGKSLVQAFPEVTFYDYTKSTAKAIEFAAGLLPSNYHVTFSRSENSNAGDLNALLNYGVSIAVPYVGNPHVIATVTGMNRDAYVVNGDAHDLRFLDPRGSIVALTAKGRAKRDTSGFVVRCA